LNEARDQNELLEFRILELEEIQERVRLHHLNDFECVIILVTHQVLFQ
jgi:hypothetical protein